MGLIIGIISLGGLVGEKPKKKFHFYSSGLNIDEGKLKLQQMEFVGTIESCCMPHALLNVALEQPFKDKKVIGPGDVISDDYAFYLITEEGFDLICPIDESSHPKENMGSHG